MINLELVNQNTNQLIASLVNVPERDLIELYTQANSGYEQYLAIQLLKYGSDSFLFSTT